MSPAEFQALLLSWFAEHGRKDLPWQQAISPYRVWLSEIMLQQTQVSSVIPYFLRFTERFPNLHSLAAAELDEVLLYWSGLGYYARARNLHKTARLVVADGGEFPENITELSALPGIGRSTAGAILSIACGQYQAILDGNVKRVFARFHAVRGWPGQAKVAERLWEISQRYTAPLNTGAYTQAIMDLGATLCTRSKPKCEICPVASACLALAEGLVNTLPEAKPRKALPVKQIFFLILSDPEQRILLEKRPPSGIWGGLWSLPEFAELAQLRDWCRQLGADIAGLQILPAQRHTFSHYHLDYTPVSANLINPINNVMEANSRVWYKSQQIGSLGLPTPIKRLLQF
ncbi:A/G-specific adenine glycosylase [Methylomonas paludis]|uniref:Adenine DNA glycosylase n=2 Tax=Methylomonas paludis TaxID=1173101 RepID=A0A975MRI6_9GAMM|nr:A/G-specific adenine glycosylase [Methylomonas paludis]QWF72434.1 A/G-specific adenine glycosylase [Methylomonas paludis]